MFLEFLDLGFLVALYRGETPRTPLGVFCFVFCDSFISGGNPPNPPKLCVAVVPIGAGGGVVVAVRCDGAAAWCVTR